MKVIILMLVNLFMFSSLLTSCREYKNPYDPAVEIDTWIPKELKFELAVSDRDNAFNILFRLEKPMKQLICSFLLASLFAGCATTNPVEPRKENAMNAMIVHSVFFKLRHEFLAFN